MTTHEMILLITHFGLAASSWVALLVFYGLARKISSTLTEVRRIAIQEQRDDPRPSELYPF